MAARSTHAGARAVAVPGKQEIADVFSWARQPICDGPEYCWLIVSEGGRVMGYVQYRLMRGRADTAIIDFLETRAYYRRRGYGRQIVAHLQAGFGRLVAHRVRRSARPFWQAVGFAARDTDASWDDDWYWQSARAAAGNTEQGNGGPSGTVQPRP